MAEEVLEGVSPDPGRDPEPHVVDLGALQLLGGKVAAVVRHPLRPIRVAGDDEIALHWSVTMRLSTG